MKVARTLCSSPRAQVAWLRKAGLQVRCSAAAPAVQQQVCPLLSTFCWHTSAVWQHTGCAQASPEVVQTRGVPVLLYAPKAEVEPEALNQLVKLAESGLPVSSMGNLCSGLSCMAPSLAELSCIA